MNAPNPSDLNRPTEVKVHHNIPQVLYLLVKAQITLCLWGRATGKTEGPGADFILDNVLTMPRSLGGVVSSTFDKILMFIIPKLMKGWERYGYLENVHYWVRKFAPEELKRDRPYLKVQDPKYFVHWWNGSGQQLISLDRLGISNASDLDYLYLDEGRLVKKDNFDEVINANRGNAEHFGDFSQHHSILITSDMPRDQRGRWMFDYLKEVDQEIIDTILIFRQRLFELEESIANIRTEKGKKKAQALINKFEDQLNELRKGTVFVSEASTLDNVHALGIETLLTMKKNLSDFVFDLSVLNNRVAAIENGFYAAYIADKHTYTAVNNTFLENHAIDSYAEVKNDCRWYTDYFKGRPLNIAFDHNASITWCVTGQLDTTKKIARQQSALFVEHPRRIKHLVDLWHEWYQYHPTKQVFYYYDHTSIGEDSSRDYSFATEIQTLLKKKGWLVIPRYIGKTSSHRGRYEFWGQFFAGKHRSGYQFMANESTNQEALFALEQTGLKYGRKGFEKDKSPETNPDFPQVEAPHATDAMDTLWYGMLHSKAANPGEFFPTMTG